MSPFASPINLPIDLP
ncbi:hypothetical protein AZE42_11785 [Rhizopogon vesiculosus]|uniref:Uncharacterized protein n=1 Tax=Rhizopogon vesiculosus TaxID=180088 RepID=A0A1J8QTN3_9AGAM|nr:hypothetical protein AZE42_11785 [Rhizopogon vesiculosus]